MGHFTPELLNFLKQHSQATDIFCLQEIYSDAQNKEQRDLPHIRNLNIFQDIEQTLTGHAGYFRPAYKDYYGVAMFIRKTLTVEEEGDFEIYHNPGDKPATGTHSRNLQFARINSGGKTYTINNVHGLWNGQGKSDTPDRIAQSQNIRNIIGAQHNPKILCGDFNLLPGTDSLKIASEGLRDLITEYNITDTRTVHYDKGPDSPRYADYVFTSEDVMVTDFKVLPDAVSDHAALILEFN